MASAGSSTPTRTQKSGKVADSGHAAQHVDLYRKLLLRRRLYSLAEPGPIYVPFIGDGDIAAELYTDRRIFGADLDPARVATASGRLPEARVIVADCNGWPFGDVDETFAVADLDTYANPYIPLVAFWSHAKRTRRVVIFGTDALRIHTRGFSGEWILGPLPEAKRSASTDKAERRDQYNHWWTGYVRPWIAELVAPARIVKAQLYQRQHMLYWGIVVDADAPAAPAVDPEDDKLAAVEDALYQAAVSGNVTAIQQWLARRDRRELAAPGAPIGSADAELGF